MFHGVYSTLDTMIVKYPRLVDVLIFSFVLCPFFFFFDPTNDTSNSCAGRSTKKIMNHGLGGAIVRAIFDTRQMVLHRIALNPNHSEAMEISSG